MNHTIDALRYSFMAGGTWDRRVRSYSRRERAWGGAAWTDPILPRWISRRSAHCIITGVAS